jgi:YbbR domain-containing protein
MNWLLDEIKKVLRKGDLTAKLVCILGAIMLWAYVGSMKVATVRYRVPVELRNIPSTMIVTGNPDMFVNIVLNGKKDDVKSVNLKNIKPYINLESAVPGKEKKYKIEFQKSDIPEGIEVELSRKRIALELEKKMYKRVRIVPRITWDRQDGYVLGLAKVVPEYVIVTGGGKGLSRLRTISTKRIIIEGKQQHSVKEVLIDTDGMNDIIINSQRVVVNVPVFDVHNLNRIELPVKVKITDDRYKASAVTSKIEIYVKASADMADLTPEKLEAFVDLGTVNIEALFGEEMDREIERSFAVTIVNKQRRDIFKPVHAVPDEIVVRITRK